MKKHLIAAAVAAAVAVPAFAQNVTVYGILDTAIQSHDDGTDRYVKSADGLLSTSRLGFRGSEDLGGGLKAEFNLEMRLNPSDGSTKQTTATTVHARNSSNYKGDTTTDYLTLFARESWVGFSGGFGAVRVGESDVTDANNIDSKVSYGGDLALNTGEFDGDLKNVVRYTSPVFNGLQAQVGFSNSSAAAKTGEVRSIYAQYEVGPLGVYFGRSTLQAAAAQKDTDTKLGVKYDLGVVALGVSYYKRDNEGVADYTRTVVNAAVPLGNGLTAHAVYKSYDVSATATGDDDTMTIALTKAVSKRTTAYAAYSRVEKGGTAADTATASVGVRHSF